MSKTGKTARIKKRILKNACKKNDAPKIVRTASFPALNFYEITINLQIFRL